MLRPFARGLTLTWITEKELKREIKYKRRVLLKEKPQNVILAERLSSGHQGKNERQ